MGWVGVSIRAIVSCASTAATSSSKGSPRMVRWGFVPASVGSSPCFSRRSRCCAETQRAPRLLSFAERLHHSHISRVVNLLPNLLAAMGSRSFNCCYNVERVLIAPRPLLDLTWPAQPGIVRHLRTLKQPGGKTHVVDNNSYINALGFRILRHRGASRPRLSVRLLHSSMSSGKSRCR